jgi:microcystin-dependent protein
MSQPFIGEIRLFAGNFAPQGWRFCDGSLLVITDYDALFNLIGTTYGGDGQNTFGLPDLRGRVPLHPGNGVSLAEQGGTEQETLTLQQIPSHFHAARCRAGFSDSPNPAGSFWGASNTGSYAGPAAATANMDATALGLAGATQPHDNMMPFVGINFIISLFGIYPTPS